MDSIKLTFDIAVIGSAGVGKTSYLARFTSGHFVQKYEPTENPVIARIEFNTNIGRIILNMHDFAGQSLSYSEYVYGKFDGFLHMADDRNSSLDRVVVHRNAITTGKINGDRPFVIAINKSDIYDQNNIAMANIFALRRNHVIGGAGMFMVSAKSMYQIDAPLLYLIKKCTGVNNIEILHTRP